MKYIFITLVLTLLVGCNLLPVKQVEERSYKLNLKSTDFEITEYTIDSCQYIGVLGGDGRSNFLTHKGNCTNYKHCR